MESNDNTISRQRDKNAICEFALFNNGTSVSGSLARKLVITNTDRYVVRRLVRGAARSDGLRPTRSRNMEHCVQNSDCLIGSSSFRRLGGGTPKSEKRLQRMAMTSCGSSSLRIVNTLM